MAVMYDVDTREESINHVLEKYSAEYNLVAVVKVGPWVRELYLERKPKTTVDREFFVQIENG